MAFFGKREESLLEKIRANTKKLVDDCLNAIITKAKAALPAINDNLLAHSKISREAELKFTLDSAISLTEEDAFDQKDREYALTFLSTEYTKQGFKVVVDKDNNTFTISW
ncbi:Hypothetical protein ORPV_58 [Orpheovirus IHUMI-LCC2]|uniref:Uncharacterized protein n=1 Tax=Orpheovirus IHUMI-LCC2 TaxID=2023057 RepID=A0A2I2L349_9VIRU|nr:Hypothetical protein ORPV_58 [Orpheovirus IHUMI-LCC2]SNW61962.1 Hypothetical protein ORPV_58 [Orpheovirus IHUMI-LCC2]